MNGTIAEIRLFAGNFNPRFWAFCNGSLLSIASNTALFSLLGTTYGGNGTTNFGLPDLRGRTALGTGTGPGLTNVNLGEISGTENLSLIPGNIPTHNHTLAGASAVFQGGFSERVAPDGSAVNHYPAVVSGANAYSTASDSNMANLNNFSLGNMGGGSAFSKRPPYLGMNYIICLQGIFPSRN